MEKFFQMIKTKFFLTLLFGLFQLHFSFINNQNIEYNIIYFKEEDFLYLSFANYSNGDMIFSSTAKSQNEKRIFYGFKKNGRPFFQNETSYFYSMNSTKESNWEYKNLGTRYQMQIRWNMIEPIPGSVMHFARLKEVV